MIEISGLRKHYFARNERVTAIAELCLKLERAERFGIFGPSGCGKSTFLRCIAGLETPDSGRIVIDGVTVFDALSGTNLPPWKRPIGIVFQDLALWPHMSILNNVLFPLRHGVVTNRSSADQLKRARDVLCAVRLSGLENRYPSELSGGQRQRAALARAIAPKPKVLLLDEPFSSLDAHLRKQTRNELVAILQETGITTIFVSHDHIDGLFMAHRVGVMRDGTMIQVGSSQDLFHRPVDATVAEAFNIGTIVVGRPRGTVTSGSISFFLGSSEQTLMLNASPIPLHEVDSCSLLFRADACRLWTNESVRSGVQKLAGVVVQENYTGRGWCVLVRVAEALIEVWEDEQPSVRAGEHIAIAVDTQRVQLVGHRQLTQQTT